MRQNKIGPLDGLFGILSVFDWVTPAIQLFRDMPRDVVEMATGQPGHTYLSIHGADMPAAIPVLEKYGILKRGNVLDHMLKVSHGPFYPADPWQMVRVPNNKLDNIQYDMALRGIRLK